MNQITRIFFNFARKVKKPIDLSSQTYDLSNLPDNPIPQNLASSINKEGYFNPDNQLISQSRKKGRLTSFQVANLQKQKSIFRKQEVDQQFEDQIIPFTVNQNQPQSLKRHQQTIKQKLVKNLHFKSERMHDPLSVIQDQNYDSNKIVNRPNKGVVWGLGGQLMVADKKVHLVGLKDDLDQIIEFLQLHQVKNIYVHDFQEESPNSNRRRYSLIGSCFSAKHCWKTGLQLKNAFNLNSSVKFHKRRKTYDPISAFLNGSKNQDWSMVQYKDYQINLMTEQQRETMDLQYKWNNQVSQDRLDKYSQLKQRKGVRNQYQDF